ncbi:MAG: siderophore-interacting protein [Paracoccus sp. (in: a-proteobacteria)]
MRRDQMPHFQAQALLDIPFEAMDRLIRDEAAEHGLELHTGHGRSIRLRLGAGEYGARRNGAGSIAFARAESRDWLFTLQEALAFHIADRLGGALDWAGFDLVGQLPPNFSLGRIESVRAIGAHFLRLRIRGEGLERLARDMIHFRIVLPCPDRSTQWPYLSQTGQAHWPQDLHRPAYTVAAIDPAAGWLETDIFTHDGGRVAAFAANAATGREIGLIGPAGGGIPMAPHLLIGGDETAYPALGRIIAVQSADVRIACHLFGECAEYPFSCHPGLSLIHRPMGEGQLAAELDRQGAGAALRGAGRVWIATERGRLSALKAAVLRQLPRDRIHLAAYWTAAH